MPATKPVRKSNVEILRLVSMFLIILSHYALYSGFEYENVLSFNSLCVNFFHLGGKFGVVVFIFISGFFNSTSRKFKLGKVINLLVEVFIYSLILIGLGFLLGTVSLKEAVTLFFAVPLSRWEFITCYVMLFCLSPWINKLIEIMDIKSHFTLISFLTVVWCISPSFLTAEFGVSTLAYYIYIYMFAALIRRLNFPNRKGLYLTLAVGSYLLIFVSEIVLLWLSTKTHPEFFIEHSEHFRNLYSVFILIAAVSIFLFFYNLNVKSSTIINRFASTTLAVFILHDNIAIRSFIWGKVFNTLRFQSSYLMPLHAIFVALTILIVFSLVDLGRQFLMDRLLGSLIDRLEDNIHKRWDKVCSRFSK